MKCIQFLLLALCLAACDSAMDAPDAGGGDTSMGDDSAVGRDAATDTLLADSAADSGAIDSGEPSPYLEGPMQVLAAASPTQDELDARPFDEVVLAEIPTGGAGAPPATVEIETETGTQTLEVHWGVMSSGTFPTIRQQAVIDFLGPLLDGELPRTCRSTPRAERRPASLPRRRHLRMQRHLRAAGSIPPAPGLAGDVEALMANRIEVRQLHAFMVAWPVDAAGAPQIESGARGARRIVNTSPTRGNGYDWLSGDPGGRGERDRRHRGRPARHRAALGYRGAPPGWPSRGRATECSRNVGTRRDRSTIPESTYGAACGTENHAGWADANDYVTLMNAVEATLAQIVRDRPLDVDELMLFPSVPYMRVKIGSATLLQRNARALRGERGGADVVLGPGRKQRRHGLHLHRRRGPNTSTSACAPSTNVFDFERGETLIDRFVTDWGLCERGGINAAGVRDGKHAAQLRRRRAYGVARRSRRDPEPARRLGASHVLSVPRA